MKLSELVAFRNQLKKENLGAISHTNLIPFEQIVYTVESSKVNHLGNKIRQSFDNIVVAHDKFKIDLNRLILDLNKEIESKGEELSRFNWDRYQEEFTYGDKYDDPMRVFDRKVKLSDELVKIFISRLIISSDWRVPGLIIRPGQEPWIHRLVNLDPLYLADTRMDLLEPSMNLFNDQYKNRLCPYVISENSDKKIFRQLPQNQFGLIFAYNYLNFKPLPVVLRYLDEFKELLRPGGKCIFTFNNCDHEHGVINAEKNYGCYTPGHKIFEHLEKLGFEQTWINQDLGTFTWLEVKKPGTISSLRGGQTLAKIIAMPS